MSDIKDENVQQNTGDNDVTEDRLEFYIDQDSKLVFPTLSYNAVMSTDELCNIANLIFGNFADHYGTKINMQPNGQLTFSVVFAQIENRDESKYYAFEPSSSLYKGQRESGLRRVLQLEKTIANGNKFQISEDGKSAMSKYMENDTKDNKGNVRWNSTQIITSYIENPVGGLNPIPCNVINFVSVTKVLEEVYGTKARLLTGISDNGDAIIEETDVYYLVVPGAVVPKHTIYGMATPTNEGPFQVEIKQVSTPMTGKTLRDLGINYAYSSNIIRNKKFNS